MPLHTGSTLLRLAVTSRLDAWASAAELPGRAGCLQRLCDRDDSAQAFLRTQDARCFRLDA